MVLEREIAEFKNEKGEVLKYYKYYVVVYNTKVYLTTKDKADTKWLNAGFESKVK